MKLRSLVFLVVIALAAGGGWWWQRANATRTIVVRSLPPLPDLTSVPAALRDEIGAAEKTARSPFTAERGLARLSRLYHANGFLAEAMSCYTTLAQLEPGEPRWLHRHATILSGYGEIEPSILLWQRALALEPNYLPMQLRLGDSQLKANRPEEAAAIYRGVFKREPANSYALLGLARLDYEAGRWPEAQEKLEAVVRQTNYVLGYDLIVTLYERSGQTEKALAIRGANKASGAFRDPPDPWIEEMMDVCFDPYRLALTAGFLARNNDAAQAIRLLERAIELAPDDVSSRFQLGTLSVAQRNFAVAREQLERCTRLAPDFADAWAQLSGLQAQLGEESAAAKTLATGLVNCPTSPGLHLMRARTLQKSGLTTEAVAEFRESIRLRPNEADAYIELANFLIGLNQVDEAVRLLQAALEAEPGNPMALGTLAYHSITTGDETAARRWFNRVRNQPRVAAEQITALRAAFEQQFGHPLP